MQNRARRPLTICSLMVLPSNSTVRILKSTPIVLMYDSVYVSSAARAHSMEGACT